MESTAKQMIPVDFKVAGWEGNGANWITADFPQGVFYLQSEVDAIKEWYDASEACITLIVVACREGEDIIPISFDVEMPVPGIPKWVSLEQRLHVPGREPFTPEDYFKAGMSGGMVSNGLVPEDYDFSESIFYVITDHELI